MHKDLLPSYDSFLHDFLSSVLPQLIEMHAMTRSRNQWIYKSYSPAQARRRRSRGL